jgi:hypothetical protein
MDTPAPTRYRVSIVSGQAITGKVVPKTVAFAITLVGSGSPPSLIETRIAPGNMDSCLALWKLGSVVVEADENMVLRKGDWQARVISAALRGAFPKPSVA